MTSRRRHVFLFKEAGWVIAGQMAAVLGALALVRLLTELLDAAQYGQLALALTIAGLVNQVVTGGITNSIARYYSIAAEQNDLGSFLRASRRLMAYATAVILCVAVCLLLAVASTRYAEWTGLTAAALLYALTSSYSACLLGVQNAARLRASAAVHGGVEAWLRVLFSFALVTWLGASSAAAMLASALASLLVIVSQLACLRRSLRVEDSTNTSGGWTPRMWAFAWPFSAWGAFTWAQQASDRWALEAFTSIKEVGLYAVVYQLGYLPIGLATGMATTLLGPLLYQRAGSATDPSRNASVHVIAWRMALLALAATAVAFVTTWGLHEPIFGLLAAAEYRAHSHLLPWIVLAGGTFAAAQMLALKFFSEMKPAPMAAVKIVTAALGVALNMIAAAHHGVRGVVLALLATSIVYLCWMAVLARRLDTVPPLQT